MRCPRFMLILLTGCLLLAGAATASAVNVIGAVHVGDHGMVALRPPLPPLPPANPTVTAARQAALARLRPLLRRGWVAVTPNACWSMVLGWRDRAYQIFILHHGGGVVLFPMLTGVGYGGTPDRARGPAVCVDAKTMVVAWFPSAWVRTHLNNRDYATALFMANWAQEKAAGWPANAYPADTVLDPFGVMNASVPAMPATDATR